MGQQKSTEGSGRTLPGTVVIGSEDRTLPGGTVVIGSEDNWKHRSKGMKCSTCMHFVEKVPEQGEVKVGRCRKHAPTLDGWPAMKLTDWCGDHKLDEEKVF
jgi:hypothetical protein